MKNILVFGSTGFVGKNLVNRLKKENYNISTCERTSGVDLRNYSEVYKVISENNPDIIYNLASHGGSIHYVKNNAADVLYDNVMMSLNTYKAICDINKDIKVIQPFSNCSYPGNSSIQIEQEWLLGDVHPSVFSFGNSKRSIYYISKCFYEQYGINTVNLLFPNTYGPGDSVDPNHTHALNGMIIRMLDAKKKGDEKFVVWGTGSPVREWAYIDDFVEGLARAIELDNMVYPINIGQEKGYSIAESAAMIKEEMGYDGDIVFDTSYTDGDPVKVLGNENFKNHFPGFKFYDHRKGISNTIEYYKRSL